MDAHLGFGFLGLKGILRHNFTGKVAVTRIPNLIHSGKPALLSTYRVR